MTDDTTQGPETITALVSGIVSHYLTNNHVAIADVPALISTVYAALSSAGDPVPEPAPKLTPAVPIKKSVTPDHLISLEDGKLYKSLKRHLGTLGMTPDEYRTKWGLAKDYPMVAASYSAHRSELAKSLGLGRTVGAKVAASEVVMAPEPKAKRSSKPKATPIDPSKDTFT
ncbi:MucR family transcriptional regulator [Caulobacter sp. S45]|uniref:MucR family transcriptional regulator n=1 Tax=Caulobacter sp. S45 TaxID=1641861 RepID=UPI00131AB08D|nr:MucR family transcriptional regulator [Caulobacter sp. S45]